MNSLVGMRRFFSFQASIGPGKEDVVPTLEATPNIPPVIPRLLKCNDPPTDDERLAICARITEVRQEFEKWRPYAWTPFTPSELTSSPENLKQYAIFLDQHYHIISGIRTLPGELLEHILFHTLPAINIRQGHQHANWHSNIYRLMQVCKKWRNTVASSPRFWSYIPPVRMTDRVLTEESEKRAKQLFDMYRERSGEHPVFVELGTCAPPTQPEEWKREITWQEDRLAVLISLAARWESVILDTTRTTLDELLLRLAPHDLPNLRHFRLSIKNDDKSRRLSEEWTPLDLRSKSPLLRRISLVYIDVRGWAPVVSDPPRSLVKIPLSRLTEFDERIETFAGTCTIRHIRSPASGATAAIPEDTLRLEKWIGPNQISFLQYAMNRHSSHIVVLTLTISEVLYTAASAFATASYCLPLLTDLTINSAVKLPLFPFVLNTVRLSRCSLRRLTLHGFDDDEVGHLANILALSPELQHLNLKGIPAVVDLLRMQFDPTLPNAVLVPKLKTFEIEVHPGWRDSEENMKAKGHALTDMVLSRVDLVNPAHRAYVARLSAAVRTSTTSTAMRVYDQLERSVVSPDRALSTEDREVFELGTLQKWVSPLRKCVKQLGPGMNPFQGKDYDVAGRAVDNVVKAMEEYQIHGSDIRLLLKWQFPALLDRSLGVYGTVDIPCDEQYKITERLFALRERWKEVIAADIAASRHWMFTDVQTMIFLPADDAQRMDLDTLWKAAKGERISGSP